jgi:hypothetical protein
MSEPQSHHLDRGLEGSILSRKEKGEVMRPTQLLIPLVIVYLIYVCALAVLSPEGFPKEMPSGLRFPYLTEKPIAPDAYYILTVAWNIARGQGVVHNYDMPGSGTYHIPLATGIHAMLAWLVQSVGGDKWLLARVMLV